MSKTKYIYVEITIYNGEFEHDHKSIFATKCDNIEYATMYYIAHYWGLSEYSKYSNCWEYENGLAAKEAYHKELSEKEYKYLSELFHS